MVQAQCSDCLLEAACTEGQSCHTIIGTRAQLASLAMNGIQGAAHQRDTRTLTPLSRRACSSKAGSAQASQAAVCISNCRGKLPSEMLCITQATAG